MNRILVNPLRDTQQESVTGYCAKCGGELYGEEWDSEDGLCSQCRVTYDEDTMNAVMRAFDNELKKYLSDDLRDTVWNAVCNRFPAA